LTEADYAEMGEAAPIVRDLRKARPKTVVFIFDVSASMKGSGMLKRARPAAIQIVRYGMFPGDTAVLYPFGAKSEEVVQKIEDGETKRAFLDRIPSDVAEGSGTNIRRPHHEALKFLDKPLGANGNAAIVLLTDSFNDEPKRDDPAYADYLRYYTPGGQLTKYPKTGENSDYERLLAKLVQNGNVKQYGIGIGIAPSGRPLERLPQAAPPPVEVTATPAPTYTPNATPQNGGVPSWAWLVGLLTLAVGAALFAMLRPRSIGLRISGGSSGNKDFAVGGSTPVKVGGSSGFAPDTYPVGGVNQTVAQIRASGGRLLIGPPAVPKNAPAGTPATVGANTSATNAAGNSNQMSGLRVYHNGVPLETEVPLTFGDELRVSPGVPGGREVRLKFADPKQIR
jgi:hypothetical protein